MISLTIHPAKCQKCKVLENIEKSKENDKSNEIREINITERVIQNIFNMIKTRVENSTHSSKEEITIYDSDFLHYEYLQFSTQLWYKKQVDKEKIMRNITTMFKAAGYGFSFTPYSEQWQKKSRKYCSVSVSW